MFAIGFLSESVMLGDSSVTASIIAVFHVHSSRCIRAVSLIITMHQSAGQLIQTFTYAAKHCNIATVNEL